MDWNTILAPGTRWQDTYVQVTTRAKELLKGREHDEMLSMTVLAKAIGGPEATNATRGVIIRALRAGCRHELKAWHDRVEAPNPYKKGETMRQYVFHAFVEPEPETICSFCGSSERHWGEKP